MTTEELLTVLEELADNHGLILFDWEPEELRHLAALLPRLAATVNNVLREPGNDDDEGA